MKILASIVTHNRLALLERCVDKVNSQSRKPDQLIVINNGSTDGTSNFLYQSNIKHINQDNLGSSGGWRRAIDYAIDNEFDYVWMMDDDGFPDKFALEQLLGHLFIINDDVSCISSIVLKEHEKLSCVFPFPILNSENKPRLFGIPRTISNFKKLKKYSVGNLYDFAHLFNGALISINHVKKIGNVSDKYYLYGEEIDFFHRLSSSGRVLTCLEAIHYHPDVNRRSINNSKTYYLIKNSIIISLLYDKPKYIWAFLRTISHILKLFSRNGFLYTFGLIFGAHKMLLYKAIFRGLSAKPNKDYL